MAFGTTLSLPHVHSHFMSANDVCVYRSFHVYFYRQLYVLYDLLDDFTDCMLCPVLCCPYFFVLYTVHTEHWGKRKQCRKGNSCSKEPPEMSSFPSSAEQRQKVLQQFRFRQPIQPRTKSTGHTGANRSPLNRKGRMRPSRKQQNQQQIQSRSLPAGELSLPRMVGSVEQPIPTNGPLLKASAADIRETNSTKAAPKAASSRLPRSLMWELNRPVGFEHVKGRDM